MRRALGVCLVVASLAATATFPAVARPSRSEVRRYIVVLEEGLDSRRASGTKGLSVQAVASQHASRFGVGVRSVYKWAFGGYAADMTDQVASRIGHDPRVAWVEPVYRIDAPTDRPIRVPAKESQSRQTLPTGVDRVQADLSSTAGIDHVDESVNVDVAVLDTGIDVDHPDLNVVGGTSCVAEPSFADGHGHGTRVSGVIGAIDNDFGVVGVAPGARLWSIRIFDAEAIGSLETILCGIDWITQTRLDIGSDNDIDVANMSFGTPPQPGRVEDGNCGAAFEDVFHAAICSSTEAGVTYAAAAGNDSSNIARVAPAGYREVIAVSGLADLDGRSRGRGRPSRACARHLGEAVSLIKDDGFAFFSNFGRAVELIAPGVCIRSTYLGGMYAMASETSISAPHVTGGAALYKATHPTSSPAEVRAALIENGRFNWNARRDPDRRKEPLLNVARF